MKNKKQKLELNKLVFSNLTDLSTVIGGDDDGPIVDTKSGHPLCLLTTNPTKNG